MTLFVGAIPGIVAFVVALINLAKLAFSRPRTVIVERMRALGLYDDEPLHPTNRAALAALTG